MEAKIPDVQNGSENREVRRKRVKEARSRTPEEL